MLTDVSRREHRTLSAKQIGHRNGGGRRLAGFGGGPADPACEDAVPDLEQIASVVALRDPTALTTDLLRREIAGLREIIEMRLDGMDRATQLLSDNVIARQVMTDKQIINLGDLHGEKLAGVNRQIECLDLRLEHAGNARGATFDAALQALKEAVWAQNTSNAAAIAKTEVAMAKQIDSMQAIIQSSNNALSGRVNDLKERVDRSEASTVGAHDTRTEQRLNSGLVVAIVGVCVLVFSALAGLLGFTLHH